ncbi:MAG TPA: nitrilase-related carbon-nitrogen hydrolase [Victivallales bacterium]|nr:nitrilase-related carbon-nitrogen hydrolase [Victivallales bacterium]
MAKNIKIGLVQSISTNNKRDNLDKLENYIVQSAEQGAKIVSLQELANTTYIAQEQNITNFDLAEDYNGASLKWAEKLSGQLEIYLLLPYFERDVVTYYNTVALFNPEGKLIGKYRKNHIPQNTNYQEKYYFKPGNLGYPVFNTEYGKIGVSICWDHWFPEVQRIYGIKGADIVFSPTAIGFSNSKECFIDSEYKEIWQKMLTGQAITGGFYFAIINKVGIEKYINFYGSSFIISPRGKIVGELNETDEGVLVREIDIEAARSWKVHQQFTRDRRVNTYNDLVC